MQRYVVYNRNIVLIIIMFIIINVQTKSIEHQNNMISVSKQISKRSSPSISAVLLDCPPRRNKKEEEKCDRKVMVNVRVNPSMQLDNNEKYLVLDEIYDTKRKTRAKILSPYVIQLSRGQPIQMFPLEFTNEVRCNNCDKSATNTNDKLATNNNDKAATNNNHKSATNNNDNSATNNNDKSANNNNDRSTTKNNGKLATNNNDRSTTKNNDKLATNNNGRSSSNNNDRSVNNKQSPKTKDKSTNGKKTIINKKWKLNNMGEVKLNKKNHKDLKKSLNHAAETNTFLNTNKRKLKQIQKKTQINSARGQKKNYHPSHHLEKGTQSHSHQNQLVKNYQQSVKREPLQEKKSQKLIQEDKIVEEIVRNNVHKLQKKLKLDHSKEQKQLKEQLYQLIQQQNEDMNLHHGDEIELTKLDQNDKTQFKKCPDSNMKANKKNLNKKIINSNNDKIIEDGVEEKRDINEKLFEELEKLEEKPELNTKSEVNYAEDYELSLEPRSCIKNNCLKTKFFKKEESLSKRKADKQKKKYRKVHFRKRKHYHMKNASKKKMENLQQRKQGQEIAVTKENNEQLAVNDKLGQNLANKQNVEKTAKLTPNEANLHNLDNNQNLDKVDPVSLSEPNLHNFVNNKNIEKIEDLPANELNLHNFINNQIIEKNEQLPVIGLNLHNFATNQNLENVDQLSASKLNLNNFVNKQNLQKIEQLQNLHNFEPNLYNLEKFAMIGKNDNKNGIKENMENNELVLPNNQHFPNKQNIGKNYQELMNEENTVKNDKNLVHDEITDRNEFKFGNSDKYENMLSNEQNSEQYDFNPLHEDDDYEDEISSDDSSNSINKLYDKSTQNFDNDNLKDYKNLNVDASISDNSNLDHNKLILDSNPVHNILPNLNSRQLLSIKSVPPEGHRHYKYIKRIPFIESIVRPSRRNNFHSILKYPRNLEFISYNKDLSRKGLTQNKNNDKIKNQKNKKIKKQNNNKNFKIINNQLSHNDDLDDKKDRDIIPMFYTTNNGYYGSVNVDSSSNTADSGFNIVQPLDMQSKHPLNKNEYEKDEQKAYQRQAYNTDIGFNENTNCRDILNCIRSDNNHFFSKDLTKNGPRTYNSHKTHKKTKNTKLNSNNKKLQKDTKFNSAKNLQDSPHLTESCNSCGNDNANSQNKMGSSDCMGTSFGKSNEKSGGKESASTCAHSNNLENKSTGPSNTKINEPGGNESPESDTSSQNCDNNLDNSSDEPNSPDNGSNSPDSEPIGGSCNNLYKNYQIQQERSSDTDDDCPKPEKEVTNPVDPRNEVISELNPDQIAESTCGNPHFDQDRLTQQQQSSTSCSHTQQLELDEPAETDNYSKNENTPQNETNENCDKLEMSTNDSKECNNNLNLNLKKSNKPKNFRGLFKNSKKIILNNVHHNKLYGQKKGNSKSITRSKKQISNSTHNNVPVKKNKDNFLLMDLANAVNIKYQPTLNDLGNGPLNEDDYIELSYNEDNDLNKRGTEDDNNNLDANNNLENNYLKTIISDEKLLEPVIEDMHVKNNFPLNELKLRSAIINRESPNQKDLLLSDDKKQNNNHNEKVYEADIKADFRFSPVSDSKLTDNVQYKKRHLFSEIMDDDNLRTDDKMKLLDSLKQNDMIDQSALSNEVLNSNIFIDWGQLNKIQTPLDGRKKKQTYMLSNKDLYKRSNIENDYDKSPLELRSAIDDSKTNTHIDERSCMVCGGKNSALTELGDNTCMCDICARETNIKGNTKDICQLCGGKLDNGNQCLCNRKIRDLQNMNEIKSYSGSVDENYDESDLNDDSLEENNLDDINLENEILNDNYELKLQEYNNDRSKRSPSNNLRYLVYNMSVPMPFITTEIQIYQKRQNSWSKIHPSITLTSLSTVFANDDLTIILSSHINVINPDRPLNILQNHKLLVPEYNLCNETLEINKNLIAIDENKFNEINENDMSEICDIASLYQSGSDREYREINNDIINLGDFGYFPTHMNALQHCPNDKTHLCLNMLDEEIPAYSVKIVFPFRQNDLIPDDIIYNIRIIDVMTDATTWGILQVTLIVINDGLVAQDFVIDIKNNGIICRSIPSFVTKTLMPYISETITFLLPLEVNKPKQYYTVVSVKSILNQTVAKRDMIIKPTFRCFCVWKSNCNCVSNVVLDESHHILPKRECCDQASFVNAYNCILQFTLWEMVILIVILLILLALLMGCIKAIWGLKCRTINEWAYNYIQPMHRYEYATIVRRFFINVLFFLVIPFIFLCKCFIPNEEDDLLQSSNDWGCFVKQHPFDGYDSDNDNYRKYAGGTEEEDDDDDDLTILSQHIEKISNKRSKKEINVNMFDSTHDENDTDSNELNAVLHCDEMIKQMSAEHSSEEINECDTRALEAFKLIRRLIASKIVYRTLDLPLGSVVVPSHHQYSIRGYFVPSLGTGYQFFTPVPLRQYYIICPEAHALRGIVPPNVIDSRAFTRNYSNRREVLEAGDLSLRPSMDAPCINVLAQDKRMYSYSPQNN